MKGIIDNDKTERLIFATLLAIGVIAWTLAIGAVPAEPQGLRDSADSRAWARPDTIVNSGFTFALPLSSASGPEKGWESR